MNNRIQELIHTFSSSKIDAFIVTKDINIQYLTDFPASESWLLVTPKKKYYVTDFRYILEAQKGLKGQAKVVRYEKSIYKTIVELCATQKVKRLGFDDRHLTHNQFKNLKKAASSALALVAANDLVEDIREVKSAEEVSCIKTALKIHARALKFMTPLIKPGISEVALFEKLDGFRKHEKVGFSFSPIIASGPHSAFPHAKITERKLKNNEPMLLDMGIDYKGYKSDLTRMFFLGRMAPAYRDAYEKVNTAQKRAITFISAGRRAKDVDTQARKYLEQFDLAKFFGHSLGHGVGLEIHESPRLSESNPAPLKENTVVTLEPAVYLPNRFGIRIEDMVRVTKTGCEVLSADID